MSKQTLVSRVDLSSALRYSGSQTVRKGIPVTWILDEFEAFKLTARARVSMDAMPFVDFRGGSEFIIKKGSTYIFDREIVVALAYPQEKTQDILIENKNYNDIQNNITIEADKAPTCHAGSNKTITIGDTVTFYGSDYAVAPATIASRAWMVNGQPRGSANTLTYKPASVGRDDVRYMVTDSTGKKAQDEAYVTVKPIPYLNDKAFANSRGNFNTLPNAAHIVIWDIPFVPLGDTSVYKGEIIIDIMIPVTGSHVEQTALDFILEYKGVQVDTVRLNIPKKASANLIMTATIPNSELKAGDSVVVKGRKWGSKGDDNLGFQSDAHQEGTMQLKITKRTK